MNVPPDDLQNVPAATLEPTAQELGLKIDDNYRTKDVDKLAAAVRSLPKGAVALVAWRHSRIPANTSSTAKR